MKALLILPFLVSAIYATSFFTPDTVCDLGCSKSSSRFNNNSSDTVFIDSIYYIDDYSAIHHYTSGFGFTCSVYDSSLSIVGSAGWFLRATQISMQNNRRIVIPPNHHIVLDTFRMLATFKRLATQSAYDTFPATIYFYQGNTLLDSLKYIGLLSSTERSLLINNNPFYITPNPSTNVTHIILGSTNIRMLNIYNIRGALLVSFRKPSQEMNWNTNGCPSGPYIIKSFDKHGTQSRIIFLEK
jgi:hypothetical protein